jgi:hypothetical protein
VALYNSFPAHAALRLLRTRGVRYVIVHRFWIGVHAADTIRARTRRTTGAHFLAHWRDADVYAVR